MSSSPDSSPDSPRLRMFAGPNGSGKSTIKAKIAKINKDWLGVFINPDEIQAEIERSGFLNFGDFEIKTVEADLFEFLQNSSLLKRAKLLPKISKLRFEENKLDFRVVSVNAYFASVAADFIRQKLVAARKSFSFETVMSSPFKVDFLKETLNAGYRNYLYFIATDDPLINISRVEYRVSTGGHDVPKDKIESRYYRSLDLLLDAVKSTNRAFIFDNSGAESVFIAEIIDAEIIEIKTETVPLWFKKYILDKI